MLIRQLKASGTFLHGFSHGVKVLDAFLLWVNEFDTYGIRI